MSDIQKLKELMIKYHKATKEKGYDDGGEISPSPTPSSGPYLDPKKTKDFQTGFNSGDVSLGQAIKNIKKSLGYSDGGMVKGYDEGGDVLSSTQPSELDQILAQTKQSNPLPNGGLTGQELQDYIKQNPGPVATTGFNPSNPGPDDIKGPKLASTEDSSDDDSEDNAEDKPDLKLNASQSNKGPSLLDNTNPSPDDSKSSVAGMLNDLNNAPKSANAPMDVASQLQALKNAQAHDKLVGGIAGILGGSTAHDAVNQNGQVSKLLQQNQAQGDLTKNAMAQYQLADEKEKNDPTSAVSNLARNTLMSSAEQLKKMGINMQLGDISKMSASSIEKAAPWVSKMIDTQGQMAQRAEDAKNRLAMLQTQLGTKQDNKQNQAMQQTKTLLESARGNPAASQAEKDIYAAQKLNSLVSQGNLNPQMVQLAASEIAKIASGATPTESELRGLQPHTIPSQLASLAEKVANHPVGANAQEFLKQYKQYGDTITKDAQKVIQDKYGRVIESSKKQVGPENYQALQDNYINRFNIPSRTPQNESSDEMVNVVSPEGQPGTVPKANLQKALSRGFKVK